MNAQINLVTGNARSGTSMMMNCLRLGGIPIAGFKWPVKMRNQDGELCDAGIATPRPELLALNHAGVWEFSDVVFKGFLERHLSYVQDGDFVKVLIEVLPNSHVQFLDRVIVTARHPVEIYKSCVKCGKIKDDELPEYRVLAQTIGFVNGLQWMAELGLRFRIVVMDDVLENPVHTLKDLFGWLKQGNAEAGARAVVKKNKRTVTKDIDCDVAFSLQVYQWCCERDIERLLSIDLDAQFDRLKKMLHERAVQDNS